MFEKGYASKMLLKGNDMFMKQTVNYIFIFHVGYGHIVLKNMNHTKAANVSCYGKTFG